MLGGCRWKPLVMEMVTDIKYEVIKKPLLGGFFYICVLDLVFLSCLAGTFTALQDVDIVRSYW